MNIISVGFYFFSLYKIKSSLPLKGVNESKVHPLLSWAWAGTQLDEGAVDSYLIVK